MNLHAATVEGKTIILDQPEGWHILTIGAYLLHTVQDAHVVPEVREAMMLALSALRWFRLATSEIWQEREEGLHYVQTLQRWDPYAHPFQALLLEADDGRRQWAALIPRRDEPPVIAA